MAVGDVIISWLLLRQADIAASKIGSASGKEKDFFEGKIAASRYFIHNFLPLISATRAIVEREDGEIMTISEPFSPVKYASANKASWRDIPAIRGSFILF
jgi:hypothetical protein